MPFLPPNQQRQSTEGTLANKQTRQKKYTIMITIAIITHFIQKILGVSWHDSANI